MIGEMSAQLSQAVLCNPIQIHHWLCLWTFAMLKLEDILIFNKLIDFKLTAINSLSVHINNVLFQYNLVSHSCLTLCNPMNCSMQGLPVHHQLPELTQTHMHRVSDAIQPSHPRSSPSLPAPNPSQHQGLFQ